MQNLTLVDYVSPAQVNPIKQATAFPPNFVHSLDASHMILTAIACKKEGLTFAAVHDSFWTHGADIDVLNEKIRECFVELHDRDIMGELKGEFEARNRGNKYPVRIKLGEAERKVWKEDLIRRGVWEGESKRKVRENWVIWVDLKFPSLPECGAFDIGDVRESRYFFH
jgi:DNA-directed RNA polymerase